MTLDLTANPNTEWASIFLNELALAGLSAVCFAPGSRSTPLILAADANPAIRLFRHLDERSASFFALGMARASGRPVALVCTSGSAVANFHPAVIEAFESQVPLLILTADRPPELRGSGANQTIDQIKFFGNHVRQFVEMPVPQENAPELIHRHLRTLAARVFASASGPPAGPVQVNFPFRKPLEPASVSSGAKPTEDVRRSTSPTAYSQFARGVSSPTNSQIEQLLSVLTTHTKGLIVCGPNCPGESFPADVASLSVVTGYPIVADHLSGVRHGSHVSSCTVLGGYDLILAASADSWPSTEVIIRFGDVPTSAALNVYIERCAPQHYFHIRSDGIWADDLHLVRHFWQVDESKLCQSVTAELKLLDHESNNESWNRRFRDLENLAWNTQSAFLSQAPLYDGAVANMLLANLPPKTAVFAGNSLPVRHVDLYDRPTFTERPVYANRGASGIDGNVSTAIGIATALQTPIVTLLGDITFYHDMNGLLVLRDPTVQPVIFVVLNNDGGGIFRRLPVSAADPPFTDLFLTPHGLSFEHAAALYGLVYHRVDDIVALQSMGSMLERASAAARAAHQSTLIEVFTDGAIDLHLHKALLKQIAGAVADDFDSTAYNIYEAPQTADSLSATGAKEKISD